MQNQKTMFFTSAELT